MKKSTIYKIVNTNNLELFFDNAIRAFYLSKVPPPPPPFHFFPHPNNFDHNLILRCESCQLLLNSLQTENERLSQALEDNVKMNKSVSDFYSVSPWTLALHRLPALAVTLILELFGGLIIAQLHKVLTSFLFLCKILS